MFTFRDRAAVVAPADALVLADVHVGRGEASAVAYPLGEGADLRSRLEALLDDVSPAEVVFAGDVLHAFDRASVATERALGALGDACRDAGARPVMVAGNHDSLLADVWDGPVHDAYELPGTDPDAPVVVRHGHEAPPDDETAGAYVVGHDHPAIAIEGVRRPCFLYAAAAYRGADVLVLPAFTRVATGSRVNGMGTRDFQSPFVTDADAFRPIVWDDDAGEPLAFPPLGELRQLL